MFGKKPKVYCKNAEIRPILRRVAPRFPNITNPIYVCVRNDYSTLNKLKVSEHENKSNLIDEVKELSASQIAFIKHRANAHILCINDDFFGVFDSQDKKAGCFAHELAHAELSYDGDIEISLSSKLKEMVEANRYNPRCFDVIGKATQISDNEYLADILAIARGFSRELLACRRAVLKHFGLDTKSCIHAYIPVDEVEEELSKTQELLPCILSKERKIPIITGFVSANFIEETYQGDYKDNKASGDGKWVFADGSLFIGRFENGIYTEGAYFYSNGDIYVGSFINGQRCDQGRMYYSNGEADELGYSGDKKDGRFNGKGKLHKPEAIYIGEFQDDFFIDGVVFIAADKSFYVGKMKDGKGHGCGRMYFSDGSVYDGEFEGGAFNGRGNCIVRTVM